MSSTKLLKKLINIWMIGVKNPIIFSQAETDFFDACGKTLVSCCVGSLKLMSVWMIGVKNPFIS